MTDGTQRSGRAGTRIDRWPTLFFPLPVVLVSVLLFLPSVGNYFMGEDFGFLLEMSRFRGWWDSFGVYEGFHRPVHVVFRYFEYRVSGLQPTPYHLASLALHAAVTSLTLVLLRRVAVGAVWAAAGALLFGIHYAHSESLMHIIATHDPLMTLLLLIGLLLVDSEARGRVQIEGSQRGWRTIAALAAFAAAFFTKETALVFPIIVFAYDALVVRRSGERRLWATLWRQWPFLALASVLFGLRWVVLSGLGGYPIRWRLGIFLENALTYVEHLTVPLVIIDLSWYQHLYGALVGFLADHRTIGLGLLMVGAVSAAASARTVLRGGSREGRILVFGVTWTLAVVAFVSPTFADRNTYLPSVGYVLAWAAGTSLLARRLHEWRRGVVVGAAGLYVLLMAMSVYRRVVFYQYAGVFSEHVVSELRAAAAALPRGSLMYLINPPEVVMSPTGSTWQTMLQFGGEEAVRVLDGKDIYIRQNSRIFKEFRTVRNGDDLLRYLAFMERADPVVPSIPPEKRFVFAYVGGRIVRVGDIYRMDWERTGLRYVLDGDGSFSLAAN